ncbi:hypothetical protein FDJ32_gp36 [Pseudomonas phage NV1]|uniref:Uncharacterized protein n=1 Tax=Pseudomonas phage NV1 TaxID=2079543 RepID=A0A2L0HPQ1_9CAUD|nr:hypothetical protein FDJ32_gp36 [Pseudomonas phage NV1]AUX83665.1 hypothetical protein NV1_p36 [Pseudomonas phage NV1]
MLLFSNKNYTVLYNDEAGAGVAYKVQNNITGAVEGSYDTYPKALIIADEYNFRIEKIIAEALAEEEKAAQKAKKGEANVVELKPKG